MDTSRRDFLKAGATAGAVAAAGLAPWVAEAAELTGKTVKLLSPEGELIEVDEAYLKPVPDSLPGLYDGGDARKGIEGRKFVMVIDLSRCKNLKKCQSTCSKMHDLAEAKKWVKVYQMQENENTAPYWQPTTCMHCDEPPCVKVCPVDATFKRQDGIVLIDNERCIGCRFCMAACPYSTRVFNWSDADLGQGMKMEGMHSPETGLPAQRGTVEKCDFCPDMVKQGELPHCVSACPNGVFYFGDQNEDTVTNGDETVRFSQLIKDKGGYRLMEELGTKPRVYYLPPVNRLFPFESGLENTTNE
ncbi:MAG: 4Fe-4S dicluster domain-containing protein [Cyclobacteriaceae bacterium]|nr:4Fe-4S dicluster domain-containing protein [Cyclobacteriaceae bacterium]